MCCRNALNKVVPSVATVKTPQTLKDAYHRSEKETTLAALFLTEESKESANLGVTVSHKSAGEAKLNQ